VSAANAASKQFNGTKNEIPDRQAKDNDSKQAGKYIRNIEHILGLKDVLIGGASLIASLNSRIAIS